MRDTIREYTHRARSIDLTVSPAVAVLWTLLIVYAALATGAIAFGVGTTLFVRSHVGPYAGLAVAGIITFGYSYVCLRVATAIRGGGSE